MPDTSATLPSAPRASQNVPRAARLLETHRSRFESGSASLRGAFRDRRRSWKQTLRGPDECARLLNQSRPAELRQIIRKSSAAGCEAAFFAKLLARD